MGAVSLDAEILPQLGLGGFPCHAAGNASAEVVLVAGDVALLSQEGKGGGGDGDGWGHWLFVAIILF